MGPAPTRRMRTLSTPVVVVTGASAGVGRAVVREFARRGARLGLIARGRAGLEAARREVERWGGEALAFPLDVADAGAVDRAAGEVERIFGPIDFWINNAMVSVFSPVSEMTAEEYRRVTEVTYLGYVHGTLSALRRMRPRNQGVIVQVGSALAYRSIPLQSAYCAAKHAIKGFTESLRTELLHERSGVHVTQVHLPAVNTPQFDWVKSRLDKRPKPVPPIYQPEIAARAIVRAALRAQTSPKRETWVGFPSYRAILAERLVPEIGDWYLGRFGFQAQQTEEAAEPSREDNLWKPFSCDAGAHGRFDSEARSFSVETWLRGAFPWLAYAVVAIAGFAITRSGRLESGSAYRSGAESRGSSPSFRRASHFSRQSPDAGIQRNHGGHRRRKTI